jgi:hypothetical protein
MAIVKIYADSKSEGERQCRSCGAQIIWAETIAGRKISFDRGRDGLTPVRSQGSMLEGDGRIVELIDTSINATHFQTCPDAAQHRRR